MKQNIYFPNFIMQLCNRDSLNITLIIAVWILMIILINPLGDFPLNDDWAYAESVKYFLETGKFRLPGWAVANLMPQVFFGVLFCLPWGFSFTALRFSTLTLGLIGVLATYYLLKEISSNRQIAFLGALLIAANPIYFGLSNTFMTDVPHYAVSVLSLYFFCVGIKKESLNKIIIAVLIALVALLIRQVTGAIFCGYLVAYILKYKAKIKSLLTAVGLFILLPGVVQAVFSHLFWPKNFGHYGAKEQEFVSKLSYIDTGVIINFVYFALCALLYLGCFLLPFLVLSFYSQFKQLKSRFQRNLLGSLLLFLISAIGTWLLLSKQRMPINGNVLDDWGIGPLTLRDNLLVPPETIPNYLTLFWIVVTILSTIGAALLLLFMMLTILQFFINKQISWNMRSLIFAYSTITFVYFLPLGLSFFFDRYLLLFLPLVMAIILPLLQGLKPLKFNWQISFFSLITILLMGSFTIMTTHDYLSWNRVRWQAINNLMEEQAVTAKSIDGGFEFNGWYLYDSQHPAREKRKKGKVWWWVQQDDYLISFNPIEGYQVAKKYLLNNWLPFQSNYIFVLEKQSDIAKP